MRHLKALILLAAMSVAWTWPLALHLRNHSPGPAGDNVSFLWNFWWMRKALSAPELSFFRSPYLLSPFGVDLINQPHTALPAFLSATLLAKLSIVEAANLYILLSVFLNAACAYALTFELTRKPRLGVLTGVAFGGSPYVAAHLFGHFDLLSAWVIPVFPLFFRRALVSGKLRPAIAAGMCMAISAYCAYDYVIYIALFAIAYNFRFRPAIERPSAETFWRGTQALMIAAATFAICCLPLLAQAFRLFALRRDVETAFLKILPRGVDTLTPLMGNPFHPALGGLSSHLYEMHGLDRIEAVGWLGIIPLVVLATGRGHWLDGGEARRWKIVLIVFAIFALGPTLTFGGSDLGLPLPQALVRFIPLMDFARMPGRAMVVVYLALGVLMGLRLAVLKSHSFASPTVQWGLVALLAADYLSAPVPVTALDRPAVYEHLASIEDNGAVIEVPFGIGDATFRIGDGDRRVIYYATLHGHPLVGGYIERMPPGVASAYAAMPSVGNLLRLSNGDAVGDEMKTAALPFRYLVLNTKTASPELVQYVESTLDMDLIASGDGRELYAVQGMKPPNLRASVTPASPDCCRSEATGPSLR